MKIIPEDDDKHFTAVIIPDFRPALSETENLLTSLSACKSIISLYINMDQAIRLRDSDSIIKYREDMENTLRSFRGFLNQTYK